MVKLPIFLLKLIWVKDRAQVLQATRIQTQILLWILIMDEHKYQVVFTLIQSRLAYRYGHGIGIGMVHKTLGPGLESLISMAVEVIILH